MKKTYKAPELEEMQALAEQMLAASVTQIGGDSGITFGEGDAPDEADVKGSFFGETIFD